MDQPEERTLDQELQRIASARRDHGIGEADRVITSVDPEVAGWRETLNVGTPFAGFDRWLLPFAFERGSCSMIVAAPNHLTPMHSHADNALHVVMSGTVTIGGTELGSGDWAYVPAGVEYSLSAGMYGAVVFYPHSA